MHKSVVMACVHRFDSPLQIAAQYLARQFVAQGWKVVYIPAPVTPFHILNAISPEIRVKCRNALEFSGRRLLNGQLIEITPTSLLAPSGRPFFRSKAVTCFWHHTAIPSLKNMLKRVDALRPKLLYIDNICLWPLLNIVSPARSIFRIMDPHEEFPGWKGRALPLARSIAQCTSGTLFSHPELRGYAQRLGAPKIKYHPNAVDIKLFSGRHPRHPLLSQWTKNVAVYAGAIDYRLDFELLAKVAHKLSDWNFVFAGPITARPQKSLPQNVHFPGPVSRQELPSFLQLATAGFLPYDIEKQKKRLKSVRPLKLLECLAAGLPVVCAHWEEVEKMGSPAFLYKNEKECVAALKECADKNIPVETYREFASKRDWSQAFEELLGFAQIKS